MTLVSTRLLHSIRMYSPSRIAQRLSGPAPHSLSGRCVSKPRSLPSSSSALSNLSASTPNRRVSRIGLGPTGTLLGLGPTGILLVHPAGWIIWGFDVSIAPELGALCHGRSRLPRGLDLPRAEPRQRLHPGLLGCLLAHTNARGDRRTRPKTSVMRRVT
jgi:hypothetical protein